MATDIGNLQLSLADLWRESPIVNHAQIVLREAFRWLVPYPHERIPLSARTVFFSYGYFVPFFSLCYLSRRRNTRRCRLALLPFVIVWALKGTYSYGPSFYHPKHYLDHWSRGLLAFNIIVKSLDLAFPEEGLLKVGETPTSLPPMGQATHPKLLRTQSFLLSFWKRVTPLWVQDILEVSTSFRGIGWKYGKGCPIPHYTKPLERGPFLISTILETIQCFLISDFIMATCHILPNISSFEGGSLFYASLPPVQRYLVSTIIHIWIGVGGYMVNRTTYLAASLIGVAFFGQSPLDWPPYFDQPFSSTSLHDFWGKRWHQNVRRAVVLLGGIPCSWVLGNAGMALGSMVASGLYHELPMYLLNKGLDHRVTLFFAVQGVGMVLEEGWKRVTGRKVGGWWGRVWVWGFMVGFGQPCVDAWLLRGLAASEPIPAHLSPSRLFVFPIITRLWALAHRRNL